MPLREDDTTETPLQIRARLEETAGTTPGLPRAAILDMVPTPHDILPLAGVMATPALPTPFDARAALHDAGSVDAVASSHDVAAIPSIRPEATRLRGIAVVHAEVAVVIDGPARPLRRAADDGAAPVPTGAVQIPRVTPSSPVIRLAVDVPTDRPIPPIEVRGSGRPPRQEMASPYLASLLVLGACD